MLPAFTKEKWLVPLVKKTDAKLHLYCFPYAGGSSNIFRSWPVHVPPGVNVIPVELPGHGKRLMEKPIDDLVELVEKMGAAIGASLREPFAFYGHSMGALLAFELARFLRRHGLALPMHLFVSAHVAPHIVSQRDPIYNLPEQEFVGRLRDLDGTPPEVLDNKELRELFLPIIRSDFQVCETYNYRDSLTLDCPITAFCGEDDGDVASREMEEWRKHTLSTFQLKTIPGGHFFLHSNEERFMYILREELKKVLMNL